MDLIRRDGQQTAYLIRAADVKPGTILTTDDGFTCMRPTAHKEVFSDEGGLYVECDEGHHYLDGQQALDDPELLVGFLIAG